MNAFEQAVAAHEEWKRTFERAVRNGGGDFQVEAVRVDDRCPLGIWLHGDARQEVANPTASGMLRDIHAEFHTAAADVLALALDDRVREAVHGMGGGTQYGQWSAMLLHALNRYAEEAGAALPGTQVWTSQ